MKKKMLTMCLLTGMILAVGCGNKNNGQYTGEITDPTENTETIEERMSEVSDRGIQLDEAAVSTRISYVGETYEWEEISVIIPQEWSDKYIVKQEENHVSFIQKASHEKAEGYGFLCSISRTDEFNNSGTGEVLVAYTDDGMLYYVATPTDVTCYLEDEAIAAEYGEMMQYVDWIAGSMKVEAENVHYDVNQYMLPTSSILPLEQYHVVNMTNNQLWIARNEIYARHGKIFQNEYLASYFDSCSWYEAKEGKAEVSERELNEVEIANLQLIIAAEEAYEKEHPYPQEYMTGEDIEVSLYADTKQNIRYEVIEEADWEYQCILTIDGTAYDLFDYITMDTPIEDVFYITDIAYYDNKLEVAVLDNGPSDDPLTHFFQYDGQLKYTGCVQGFPFEDYGNNHFDGFSSQNIVVGTRNVDMIETAYVEAYYWYNSNTGKLELTERLSSNYTWFDAHELYVDIPVYYTADTNAPVLTLQAQSEVYFISTDCEEWILVRGADGVEGYIQVEDGKVLNIGLPAEEVFSELYFFG